MKANNIKGIGTVGLASLGAVVLLVAGCETTPTPGAARGATAAGNPGLDAKGGSQLWAENCLRCHNIRSPSAYSDAQWEVAMHHMRVRGNLTAEEHRSITEFLKSAN